MALKLTNADELAAYIMKILVEIDLETGQQVPIKRIDVRLIEDEHSLLPSAWEFLKQHEFIQGDRILSEKGSSAIASYKTFNGNLGMQYTYKIKRGIF